MVAPNTWQPNDEALQAFHDLCRFEGIIPALESSHALAYAKRLAPTLPKDQVILVNLSDVVTRIFRLSPPFPASNSNFCKALPAGGMGSVRNSACRELINVLPYCSSKVARP